MYITVKRDRSVAVKNVCHMGQTVAAVQNIVTTHVPVVLETCVVHLKKSAKMVLVLLKSKYHIMIIYI
jgi:hypothetical protein